MSRRRIVLALALVLVIVLSWRWLRPSRSAEETSADLSLADELGARAVTLFFGNSDGDGLVSETRTISARRHRDEEIEVVIGELLAGPSRGGAVRTFPPDTQLRQAFYDEAQRLLYLDFNRALVAQAMGGSAMETLTLGALLRTIAIDFPEVEAVQILVDGLEVETLGGHLDLTRPLKPESWL
jgi:spore germination protein GerM